MENKKKTLREHGVEYTYDERFLPLTQKEMQLKGWEQPDFVYVIGDAYVDHPSFGPAIISRVLEAHGYKVAIISQLYCFQEKTAYRCIHPGWRDGKTTRLCDNRLLQSDPEEIQGCGNCGRRYRSKSAPAGTL